MRRAVKEVFNDTMMIDNSVSFGSKRHSLQAVELSRRSQTAVQIVSKPPAPKPGGARFTVFGKPPMRTCWMAGAAPHESG